MTEAGLTLDVNPDGAAAQQPLRSRKPVMEREAARQVLTAIGLQPVNLRSRPRDQDPPDCEATIDGQWCGIEVTKFLHQKALERSIKAIKARARGEVPPKTDAEAYRHWLRTKGEAYAEWTRESFLAHLQERIDEKDNPKEVKGGPYDRYILVIVTNEFTLDRCTVESFLTGATFQARMIDTVLFGLPYHSDLQGGAGSYPCTAYWRGVERMSVSSASFDLLLEFLSSRMRMSHIYQPLMLKMLIQNGGWASTRDIAASFLTQDDSQIDYYVEITKQMPGPVLKRHQLVEREGDGYRLIPDVRGLTSEQRSALIRLCDEAVETYRARRGDRLYQHRRTALGEISGSDRYEILKRAGFRCELCGISADEAALDVDHIIPRRHGGSDDRSNLQALCWRCNANKGARDSTDFRRVREGMNARQDGCIFCHHESRLKLAEMTSARLHAA